MWESNPHHTKKPYWRLTTGIRSWLTHVQKVTLFIFGMHDCKQLFNTWGGSSLSENFTTRENYRRPAANQPDHFGRNPSFVPEPITLPHHKSGYSSKICRHISSHTNEGLTSPLNPSQNIWYSWPTPASSLWACCPQSPITSIPRPRWLQEVRCEQRRDHPQVISSGSIHCCCEIWIFLGNNKVLGLQWGEGVQF
jgi:hypothetical protein